MHSPANMDLWIGRIDQEPEGDCRRWHQCVSPWQANSGQPGVALLGIASDAGVKRNLGRPGAAGGPDAIRRALANQAWHITLPCYDVGNLSSENDDVEKLQHEQADLITKLLKAGHFPLLLGGGHDMAFGSYLGLAQYLEQQGDKQKIGIINFDAHFDLRSSPTANSGTPFLQIAEDCRQKKKPFRYFCLGISETGNTGSLFSRAKKLEAQWMLDEQLTSWRLPEAEKRVRAFLKGCDVLYLSIDLDALPASVAPGVSSPAPRGMPLDVLEHLLSFILVEARTKLRIADIVECNPQHDTDGKTASVAARLCHVILKNLFFGKGET